MKYNISTQVSKNLQFWNLLKIKKMLTFNIDNFQFLIQSLFIKII
jgi:hypothetical protein